jgi:hypothetical protein
MTGKAGYGWSLACGLRELGVSHTPASSRHVNLPDYKGNGGFIKVNGRTRRREWPLSTKLRGVTSDVRASSGCGVPAVCSHN